MEGRGNRSEMREERLRKRGAEEEGDKEQKKEETNKKPRRGNA